MLNIANKAKKNKKELLRKTALKKRELLFLNKKIEIKSLEIIEKITKSKDFINSSNIALYYPIRNEISLLELLKFKDKKFYFPKCCSKNLEFIQFDNDFKLDKFNIPIPDSNKKISPNNLDLIYIPALIANSKGYRLGYGAGFYDRFFKDNKIQAKKIIVIAKELVDDSFVEDSWDIRCDEIISA